MGFDCTDIKALLSGLLDGELDHETRHDAERHVAECTACRGMIDDAERLHRLVAAESDAITPAELPEGFEQAVLGRTAWNGTRSNSIRRWFAWTGWMAAAAAIALAGTLWYQGRGTGNETRVADKTTVGEPGGRPAGFARSHVLDVNGGQSVPVVVRPTREALFTNWAPHASTRDGIATAIGIDSTTPIFDAVVDSTPISIDDSVTINQAAFILEDLLEVDLDDPDALELVRFTVEYDELLARLAEAMDRLQPAERLVALAAESALLRLVHGPADFEGLNAVREAIRQMNLAERMHEISDRWDPRHEV